MKKYFYSIATHNYLSQLMCACDSFNEHNDDTYNYIFVIDAKKEHIINLNNKFINYKNKLEFFCIDDVERYKDQFKKCSEYYDNFEMSCFSKIIAAAYIFSKMDSDDILIFSDADLYFKESIQPLIDEMNTKDILLTPHINYPEEDSMFEQEYLIHGWINAGFMIFRKGNIKVEEIFSWLIDRIFYRGFNAPYLYMFVDQSWISSLPFLFKDNVVISNNQCANVAYWNLNERKVSKKNNQFYINDKSLIFFHFSGYDKNQKEILSKHYRLDKLKEDFQEIRELIYEYNERLENNRYISKILSEIIAEYYKFSNDKLMKRIVLAEKINKINLIKPTINTGFLTRIARKIEGYFIN